MSGLWVAWAEDTNLRRGRDGNSLVGGQRFLVACARKMEARAMHAQTVVGRETTRDRPQGPKRDSGKWVGDWPRAGVLEIGEFNHNGGEREEGGQKTGEGGGYRAELRTLLPNGKIKGRMS